MCSLLLTWSMSFLVKTIENHFNLAHSLTMLCHAAMVFYGYVISWQRPMTIMTREVGTSLVNNFENVKIKHVCFMVWIDDKSFSIFTDMQWRCCSRVWWNIFNYFQSGSSLDCYFYYHIYSMNNLYSTGVSQSKYNSNLNIYITDMYVYIHRPIPVFPMEWIVTSISSNITRSSNAY